MADAKTAEKATAEKAPETVAITANAPLRLHDGTPVAEGATVSVAPDVAEGLVKLGAAKRAA